MTPADKISTVAAFIALLALLATFWQGHIARDHNKRSVRPLLYIDRDTRLGHDIELVAHNRGVGPAIIDAFTLSAGTLSFTNPTTQDYADLVRQLGLDPQLHNFTADIPVPGNVVAVDGAFSIIKFDGTGSNPKLHATVEQALPKLSLSIAYRDIYDQRKRLSYTAAS